MQPSVMPSPGVLCGPTSYRPHCCPIVSVRPPQKKTTYWETQVKSNKQRSTKRTPFNVVALNPAPTVALLQKRLTAPQKVGLWKHLNWKQVRIIAGHYLVSVPPFRMMKLCYLIPRDVCAPISCLFGPALRRHLEPFPPSVPVTRHLELPALVTARSWPPCLRAGVACAMTSGVTAGQV